jgi:CRISPR-associated protein Csx17
VTHLLRLDGIRPEPLASYLKAVAILRIIGEQADRLATGAWDHDTFTLRSRLDRDALLDFFLREWSPTPLVAPWNGGSGFNAGDQRSGVDAIAESDSPRFARYRAAIDAGRRVLERVGREDKALLVASLRSELPDEAIRWLDGCIVLSVDSLGFPPLLGTGGIDGRFEFSNNQMQRLAELFMRPEDPDIVRSQLAASLFGGTSERSRNAKIGQFAPGQAGGANTGMGFNRDALINPWDFVLGLEGAFAFAASATRALTESRSSFPFFVRASASGYASASDSEESRGELWMPLWEGHATHGEIGTLVSEGRAWVGGRLARTGADFARAIRQLGVARGIGQFQRFTIAQRNGLAFFATSAGRYRVSDAPTGDPLAAIDGWLEILRQAMRAKLQPPASVRSALGILEGEVLRPGRSAEADESLLLALGALSSATIASRRHPALEYLPPMPRTAPGSWSRLATASDPVWRITFSLAAAGIRSDCQPVTGGTPLRWSEIAREGELSASVPFVERLLRIGLRRLHRPRPEYAYAGTGAISLNELISFVAGELDEVALALALEAAMVTDEPVTRPAGGEEPTRAIPYVLALSSSALLGPPDQREPWPLPTPMLEALARGDGERALAIARLHLMAREVQMLLPAASMSRDDARRIGAALLFPLSSSIRRALWRAISTPTPRT